MSYEGYEQHICKNGHRFDKNCDYGNGPKPVCSFCNAESVFCNCVDETNCEAHGLIPDSEWEKMVIQPEVTQTCPTCSHCKTVTPTIYRVPSEEELKMMRHYRSPSKDYALVPMYKRE